MPSATLSHVEQDCQKFYEFLEGALNLPDASFSPETSFSDDLDVDSLDLLALVMQMEREFQVKIHDEAVPSIRTVGDALRYVENGV